MRASAPPEDRLSFYDRVEHHAIEVLVVIAIVAALLAGGALYVLAQVKNAQDDAVAAEHRSECVTRLVGAELGFIVGGLRANPTADSDDDGIPDRVEELNRADEAADKLAHSAQYCS